MAPECGGGRDSHEEDGSLTCENIRKTGIPDCSRPRPKHKIPTSECWPEVIKPVVRGGVEPPTFRFSEGLSPPGAPGTDACP